ncbi:hypothetical protein PLEIONE_190 [Mycobacterium phage Pleione]|uniref:Uncharacterized protein n=13 Tax=Bixzunavirus TaxID=680114 RepID=B5LJR8_9CAUD|nr:gp180 [Mycobacterium phage Rizal]YP_008060957.1 hypothetical protein M181_gp170 [Mycobacterium phage Gizmo]YP_009017488.1 hypothetical protein MOMOMIXON_184 [Mycobacterium phage MoMoMixon]YP_009017930.1 hypothetical protein PLEIONE_190 [Mycobacterium phage Pleione]YP_010058030.1 hypothetical protein KHO62_gp156 [Mycobacterium phage NoodleTree]YP_656161.1 gp181 [Mycobacterium phage Catera]AFL46844.1 hypothetical protein AVA3_185 [Mycobacterium phage Ava3]AID18234.1 hypothetical protein PBI
MKRVTIGRYNTMAPEDLPVAHIVAAQRGGSLKDITDSYTGYIEGETDDGRSWILFLDENGAPEIFWAKRGKDGEVFGPPVDLTDKDELGAVYGTSDHPMTWSEHVSQPRTGFGQSQP